MQRSLTTLSAFIGARRRWGLRGEALRAFQQEQGLATVRAAVQHLPYYRKRYAGTDLRRWQELPLMDKATLMSNFAGCNAAGIELEEAMRIALRAEAGRDFRPTVRGIAVGLSSGTSGHRGIFLASSREQALWAGAALARLLRGVPRGLRVAFCLRSFSRLYQAVESPLLRLTYFDIAADPEILAAALDRYAPHILVAPASLLRLLAERRVRGALRIRPSRVIAVAEVLDPLDESLVADAFGVRVEQVYQCTEGFLAASCAHGSLHIQEDIVLIQEEALPPEPGEPAGLRRIVPIVTDLWRRTQPIIRYRLNDILQMDDRPCPCGCAFRVIARVEGRCDDMLLLRRRPAGQVDGWRQVFPDSVRTALLTAWPSIRSYHVVQDAADRWCVTLELAADEPFAPVADAVQRALAQRCVQLECAPPRIDVVAGHPTPRDARGKLRRVERRWQCDTV